MAETKDKKVNSTAQEVAEREKWYEETIYGSDDNAAEIAWEMLKSDTEVDVKKALGLVYVEPGEMVLGTGDKKRLRKIEKGFWICKYICPQRMWNWVMGSNPSYFKGQGNLPVEQVSYTDVVDGFLPALKKVFPGLEFNLPDQYQFEYAARGGTKSKGYTYPGSENIDEVAWHGGNSGGHTQPVGTKKPNELGIYDMAGLNFEWIDYNPD